MGAADGSRAESEAAASKFSNPGIRFLDRAITEPVPDHVFARRAYLDVTGIPPSPAQLGRSSSKTRNSAKRTQLVDSLSRNRNCTAETGSASGMTCFGTIPA